MRTLFDFGSRGRSEWRLVHVFELVFLTIGMLCLGWYAYNWVATEVDQRWAEYQLQSSLRGQKPSVPGFAEEQKRSRSGEAPPAPAVPDPGPQPRIARGGVIGKVEIPRLDISAIVRSGVDDKTLKRAVGHVPETALPGQPGNVGIAAHRDTFFRNLKGVKVGDVIRMVTPSGTYEYAVESLKIVLPRNVEVLDPTPEPALTVVTCYPFNYIGSAPKRFIVRAKQVSPAITASQRHTENGM
jgi:sortase A